LSRLSGAAVLFDPVQFQARLNPERPGLVEASGSRDRELSYADIAYRVDAATSALIEVGVGPGQGIGVHCRDRLLQVVIVLALSRIGDATLVFSPDGQFVPGTIDLVVSDQTSRNPSLKTVVIDATALAASAPERRGRTSATAAGDATWLFTGTPTRAPISGRTLCARIAQRAQTKGTGSASRWLCAVDIHSELGLSAVMECLWAGGLTILSRGRLEGDIEPIALYDADYLLLDAAMASDYLRTFDTTSRIATRLRTAVVAGAVPAEDSLQRMKRHVAPNTIVHLDLPETGAFAASSFWQIGKPLHYWPLPGIDLRILGPGGQPVETGSTGRIAIRSAYAEGFSDGWFESRLSGSLTSDNALLLAGTVS
jgi:acyl-coenzyme A synthetase/AMP-(fatty) acid ligase